mgnify:CR=1 FL=1
MIFRILFIGIVLIAASSCASMNKKFAKLYPGMTVGQINETLGRGPDLVEPYSDGYASWYYGEDRCILVKDEQLVTKDVSKETGGISVMGMGGASEKRLAECVPPGQQRTKKVVRSVETPWGSVRK